MREIPFYSAKRLLGAALLGMFLAGSYFVSRQTKPVDTFNPALIPDEREVKIQSLLELLKLDANDYKTHAELAQLYFQLSENQPLEKARPDLLSAEKHAQEAIRIAESKNAAKEFLTEQHVLLSKIYEALGENEKALLHAEKAAANEPTKTTPLKRKGRVLEKLKKDDKARLAYLRALELDEKDPETYALLANQEFKKGNKKAAMEWLKMGVRHNPTKAAAFRNLARGYARIKKYEKAKKAYLRALELDPKNAALAFEYANFLKRTGDKAGYLTALKEAYALDNKNPKILAALADAELQAGNKQQALKLMREALRRDGRNTALREKYTTLYNEMYPASSAAAAKGDARQDSTQAATSSGESTNKNTGTNSELDTNINSKGGTEDTLETSSAGGPKPSGSKSTNSDGDNKSNAAHDIGAGKKAFAEKDFAGAEAHFKRALSVEPENADVRFFLARSLEAQGKNEATEAEYRRVLEKNPNHSKANYYLGRRLYQAKKFSESERHFARSAAADEKFAPAQYSLGLAREKQGKNDAALQAYKKASAINPSLTQAHFNSAILLKKQHKYNEALEELQKAGNGQDVHYQKGEILLKTKRYNEAKTEFTQVLAVKPNHYEAAFNLALTYHKLKDPSGADRALANIMHDDSPADLHYTYGKLLEESGELKSAEKQYRLSVNKDPQYFNGWLNLGKVLVRTQNFSQAEEAYRKALGIDPSSYEANVNLANTLYRQKKYQNAIEYFEAAKQKEKSREIILPLAASYEETTQNEKAAKVYTDFLAGHPQDSTALEHLAYLYYRKIKNNDKALETFNQLLKYHPNSKKANEYRAMVKLIEKKQAE